MWDCNKNILNTRTLKMTYWERALAANLNNLCLIHRAHVMEEEIRYFQDILRHLYAYHGAKILSP